MSDADSRIERLLRLLILRFDYSVVSTASVMSLAIDSKYSNSFAAIALSSSMRFIYLFMRTQFVLPLEPMTMLTHTITDHGWKTIVCGPRPWLCGRTKVWRKVPLKVETFLHTFIHPIQPRAEPKAADYRFETRGFTKTLFSFRHGGNPNNYPNNYFRIIVAGVV